MDIREPSKPTTFNELHHISSGIISLLSFGIFPTITAFILNFFDQKGTTLGISFIILAFILGIINTIITAKSDLDWVYIRFVSILTSPITIFKDLIMQPIMSRRKIKYKSIQKIGSFILENLEIFKKFPQKKEKEIKTDKFNLTLKKNEDKNYFLLTIHPKDASPYLYDNKLFSIKILYDGKLTNFQSNIGYHVRDEELLLNLEKNAENYIVQDILNGLTKIIMQNENKKQKEIQDILGKEFNLTHKIENTKINLLEKIIDNKFDKNDDLYIKDTIKDIKNVLDTIKSIQSQKEQNKILDEMQNHYLPKIFQSIDLYRNYQNDKAEIKAILDAWIKSAQTKVKITTNKNEQNLIQDLKVSLMAEEKLLETV